VNFGEGHQYLNLAVKKEIDLVGDLDTILMLGFHRQSKEFYKEHVPEMGKAAQFLPADFFNA